MNKTLIKAAAAAAFIALTAATPALAGNPLQSRADAETLVRTGGGGPGGEYFIRGAAIVAGGYSELGLRYMAASVSMAPDNMMRATYMAAFLDLPSARDDIEVLASVHRVAPNFVPAVARLAHALVGAGQYEAAEGMYRHWAKLDPTSAEPVAQLAELYHTTGDHKAALATLRQYAKLVGGNSEYALRRMIAMYDAMGQPKKAAKLQRQLARLEQRNHDEQMAAMAAVQ
ncbi:MAG: hypothetical protein OEY97_12260 [Nitrospirota bacterium]|nr:hypothetical protein [Nitrospirota bacterium]